MTITNGIPEATYGILVQDHFDSKFDEIAEQVRRLGYAVFDSGYSSKEIQLISESFDRTHKRYLQTLGESRLKKLDELNIIRALLTHGETVFLELITNPNLMTVVDRLITGKFILNQQNGVINPPGGLYSQSAWHRDLPYQHYISSVPLAVNALFCIDDFDVKNGSTFVLPGSHKTSAYPSQDFVQKHALQLQARAGQFIILDCMLFHSGGFNQTNKERRAINHVFTIPYFKQQIKLAGNVDVEGLEPNTKQILGIDFQEPLSIEHYLSIRENKH